jgi:glycosyltransferase involved in cell wall biosynthesis
MKNSFQATAPILSLQPPANSALAEGQIHLGCPGKRAASPNRCRSAETAAAFRALERDDRWFAAYGKPTHNLSARLSTLEHAPILVHSHLRWDFVWQRPQQIFSRLAARHPVLFMEEPVWSAEQPRVQVSQPFANVYRLVPILPIEQRDRAVDDQCASILPMAYDALASDPLLGGEILPLYEWFYSPMTAPSFLGRFRAASIIYDCMDELANFRFAPPDIGQREQFLLAHSNVVFTGGYRLFEAKSRSHSNTHFYGCGVDVGHYSKARAEDTDVPGDLASLAKPILGYFGVIDERIDYNLISALAESFRDGSVVMVGPFAKINPAELPKADNIHWVGQRCYGDLPALVKSFDVCLMPFALNEATRYINPTKTLEYMAAGKPIVSTAVPDVVRNFGSIVAIANSVDEFIGATRAATENPDQRRISQGISRAEASSWDTVVDDMRGHMIGTLL